MLTDTKLRKMQTEGACKLGDRDGMYAVVLKSGKVSFRYDYRLNGKRETVVLGQYGNGGISLAEAQERLRDI